MPPAIPTAPTPAPPPTPRPLRPGEMSFRLQRLSQPLELRQVTLDPTWNSFKTFMVFMGGVLFLLFLWLTGFSLGIYRASQTRQVVVPTVVTQPPAPPPVQQAPTVPEPEVVKVPQMSSFAECQRHYVLTLGRDPEGACDQLK